jgi:protein tyrosine/serine phosphatase
MRIGKILLTAAAGVGIICGSYAAYCGLLIWSGNHHTVVEGQLYRSAQLNGQEFGEEIDAHHIRTVLNLRGANQTDSWYQEEVEATRAHGAAHVDVGISAREGVAPEKVAQILAVLRDAPKPILVHCKSGADRTGFVAALYRYAIEGQSAKMAAHELSQRYGHFP